MATWIFGSIAFGFLLAVFIWAPNELPVAKHQILGIISAILCGLFGYFFVGNVKIVTQGHLPKWGRITIQAGGGIALFLVVLLWWKSENAPVRVQFDNSPANLQRVASLLEDALRNNNMTLAKELAKAIHADADDYALALKAIAEGHYDGAGHLPGRTPKDILSNFLPANTIISGDLQRQPKLDTLVLNVQSGNREMDGAPSEKALQLQLPEFSRTPLPESLNTNDSSQPPLQVQIERAWRAYQDNDWQSAIEISWRIIEKYRGEADRLQKRSEDNREPPPLVGTPKDEYERRKILDREPLNGVATACFILGRTYETRASKANSGSRSDILAAKRAYEATAKYRYARIWDPVNKFFWSPAEVAVDRLELLK